MGPLFERLFRRFHSALVGLVRAEMQTRAESEVPRYSLNGLVFVFSAEFLELCHDKTSFLIHIFIISYLFTHEKQKTLLIKQIGGILPEDVNICL